MANSLIDFGVVQPEASGSFLRGFEGAQAQQQQNALAALQLRAAQRGEEQALAEQEAYKSQDPLAALRAAGLGKQALAYQKTLDEQTATKLKQAIEIHKLVSDSLRGVAALGTRESAQGVLANAKAKGLDVSQYESELAQTPDAQIRQWALSHAAGADKALEQQFVDSGIGTFAGPRYATGAPTVQPTAQVPAMGAMPAAGIGMTAGIPGQTPPTRATGTNALALPAPGGMAGMGAVAPSVQPYAVPGGVVYPKVMSQAQQATEAREQQRIALEQRRVELAEKEAARKEAGLAEPLSKQEIQKREARYPQAKSSLTGFENQADDMIKKLEQLKSHKGLEGILGTVYGRTPSFTDESQAAQALYDQVMAKGKFQELQNMRLASPTGGALGNVSNMEIQSLGQAFGALSRIQGKESFKNAIDDVIKQIQSSKERTREAFEETYQYKQGKPAAAPAAGKAKFLGFEQ